MAAKFPDDAESSVLQKNLQLCREDQDNPGSCRSTSCYNLHMCREYLLNNRCSKFEADGKCSHSHSLFTRHNSTILNKKFKMDSDDTFDKVAEVIRNPNRDSPPKVVRLREESTLMNSNPIDGATNRLTNTLSNVERPDRRSLPAPQSKSIHTKKYWNDDQSIDQKRPSSSTHLAVPFDSTSSKHQLTKTMSAASSSRHAAPTSLYITENESDRNRMPKGMPVKAGSPSTYKNDDRDDHAQSNDDDNGDGNNGTSSIGIKAISMAKTMASSARGLVSKFTGKHPIESNSNDSVKHFPLLTYIFEKYSKHDELSYLFGPIRRSLLDENKYQIFPSGYCRLTSMDQEKEINHLLRFRLPPTLKTDRIQFPDDNLAFLIGTSAAEQIFEKNQTIYGIISETYSIELPIEIIRERIDNPDRSPLPSSAHNMSPRSLSNQEGSHRTVPDGKFHVLSTNSSIDVVQGDIVETKVDLMVCVTTSATLLDSVLAKAGPMIEAEFNRQRQHKDPVLLDGGPTSADKILFISWKLAVKSGDTIKTQESLSKLVKECMDVAYQLKKTSISFPSIGAGQIGLDPYQVCEAMFAGASARLQRYKMDVIFVIYPHGDPNKQAFQIFHNYLNDLCEQTKPKRPGTPSVKHGSGEVAIPINRSQEIRRTVKCKCIFTVSNSISILHEHQKLLRSLNELIKQRTYDLSLVHQSFIEQIDLLVDLCLDYHVLPHIDFSKRQLILFGDHDSCSQCFANLRNQRSIHQYTIYSKTGAKTDEIQLDMYVSLKIDEAFANNMSTIRIEDTDKCVFDIDLKALKACINDDNQRFGLYKNQLNDSKICIPNSWSPLYSIRTVRLSHHSASSIDCVTTFEQTMSRTEWKILRIEVIENWPLYVHYSNKKVKDATTAFHACSCSSVQSIIHYGLHSNYGAPSENSIPLTRDALDSHIRYARRSTNGRYFMFAVRIARKLFDQDTINLSNDNTYLALPTHLIVYQRQTVQ